MAKARRIDDADGLDGSVFGDCLDCEPRRQFGNGLTMQRVHLDLAAADNRRKAASLLHLD